MLDADHLNILWIGVDQMRADTPGYAGNAVCQTPNLDRLAAEGVSFSRAYTPAAQCSPARLGADRALRFSARYGHEL